MANLTSLPYSFPADLLDRTFFYFYQLQHVRLPSILTTVGRTMPKVACFEIAGLFCWFWSDDHDPPHFHVKRDGEWEIKVKFVEGEEEMFEQKWGDTPSGKVLRQLKKAVLRHRAALLAEWEDKVN